MSTALEISTPAETSTSSEISTQPKTSDLLRIPAEIRLEIYKHLIDTSGSLVVFAKYEITKEVNVQTKRLMQVNRLIRAEVQEFFYSNQRFEFRSTSAVDNFLEKIGRRNASLIRDVLFGEWMCERLEARHIVNLLAWLTGVESLVLVGIGGQHWGKWRWVVRTMVEKNNFRADKDALAILDASTKLAEGTVWVHYEHVGWPSPTILFLPKDVNPSEVRIPRLSRSTSIYLNSLMSPPRFEEVTVPDTFVSNSENRETTGDEPSSKRRKIC